jgi:drug/metabolite transporter (DMT)-like permease
MLCGSFSFACMSTLTYALRERCDWRTIALARAALALVFAVLLCRAAGARLVFWRPGVLWVRSLAGSVSLVCNFYALTRLRPAEALTLSNIFPIWVALLSWPLLGEVPGGGVWLSVASGVGGVVLIQQPHLGEGNFAAVLALIASVATAVAMLGLHRLHHLDPRAIVVHFSAVALLGVLVVLALPQAGPPQDGPPRAPDRQALWMLLGIGLTATVGQLFLTRAFAAGPPARVSVVGLTQIVFALALERCCWPRDYDAPTLLGMALVLAPTAWLLLRQGARRPAEVETVWPGEPPV